MISGIIGRRSSQKSQEDPATSTDENGLFSPWAKNLSTSRFHQVHGEGIYLCQNETVAIRNEDVFENSIVFSHRPIGINEILAIEIAQVHQSFIGPPRVGFTIRDPLSFKSDGIIPFGRDLRDMAGIWMKSVHMVEMTEGLVMNFMIDCNGNVWYGINGEQQGRFLSGVDTSQPLWAVVELYGEVQAIKLTTRTMNLVPEPIDTKQYQYRNLADIKISKEASRRRSLESQDIRRPLAELGNMSTTTAPLQKVALNVAQSANSSKKPLVSSTGTLDHPKVYSRIYN